jgi:hypothetical protein
MQAVNIEARQWLAGQWLNGAALAPLEELNAQCLQLVGDMAQAGRGSLLQQTLGRQIVGLSREARADLASAPYLLVDAGFDNPLRWQGLARWRVEDLPRESEAQGFCGAEAPAFVRGVLVYGWHLARAHGQLARVVLGMTPSCARSIGELRLTDLDWACEHRSGWVRLRWETRPHHWSQLLAAARANDRAAVRRASLRGIQMLGALALERKGG